MNNKLIKYFTIVILFLSQIIDAQEPIGVLEPEVSVIGTVTQNSIMLRWTANTPNSWKLANQYGYIIERKTLVRGAEVLKNPEIKRLTPQPLKPKPMMEWEPYVENNDYAAIVAQAIYGEDFDIEMQEGGDPLVNILNLSKAHEQRFSFALYAADQDFEVAKFAGLGFLDNDVKEGERYVYTVSTAIPVEKGIVKSSGIYLGLADYVKLPEPLNFSGVFDGHNVNLSWNYKLLKNFYNSYILERSDDNGNTFTAIGGGPLINASETEKNASDRMFYLDTIPQLNKTYAYRLKGKSSFGQIGPVSKIVEGKGVKKLTYNPGITSAEVSASETDVTISWEFPEEGMETLAYFELNKANTAKGTYQTVLSNIDKNKRTLTFNNLEGINYFKIAAVGNAGNKRLSFPKMVQLKDETPPAIPNGLTGVIDSTGVVELKWNLNKEPDFLGYRVFRANLENEEFTQITFEPIPGSKIIDSINIKTLNKKIYYKVQAFDKRYNPSGFSEVLTLKRPDIVPPTQPVFKSFTADKGVVELNWITSSSEDAVKTLVYRKQKGTDTPWELITDASLPQNQYKDTKATPSVTYLYTLVTMDESGLESEPITPLSIRLPDDQPKPKIQKFKAMADREAQQILVSWSYKTDNVNEFSLYRASGDGKPTLYKVFKNGEGKFVDKNLTINSNYSYLIQAVYASGAKSPMEKVVVKY